MYKDDENTAVSKRGKQKTWVPIPMMKGRCKLNGACSRLYMPLAVSFEKTIHSFQRASVGKTQPRRPDNAYHRLVGDPGTRNFEANNPGIFYTLLSRAEYVLVDFPQYCGPSMYKDDDNLAVSKQKTKNMGTHNNDERTVQTQW